MEPNTVERTIEMEVKESAIKDGYVILDVVKVAPWTTLSWNRQGATNGVSLVPHGTLSVEFPLDTSSIGEPLSVKQLASLLEQAMNSVLPSCAVFVKAADDDFGIKDDDPTKGDY